jgi:hypothetical protein
VDAHEWADDKVEQARAVYERHGRIFRGMWIAVGCVVVAAGLAMIVFPGPVTVVIPLGLVMLAAVFGWARRLLVRSIEEGEHAVEWFRQAGTTVKVLTFVASACAAAAVVAWIVL